MRGVEDGLASPAFGVLPGGVDLLLGAQVVGIVGDDQERIVVGQVGDQRSKHLDVTVREPALGDQVEHCCELVIFADVVPGPIAFAEHALHVVDRQAEQEEVLCADRSRISTLAPSRVPMVSAPFIMNFMLPVPDASLPGGRDLLGEIGRRIDALARSSR